MPLGQIYLDHAATTPLDARVLEAVLPYLEQEFGNPSSIHDSGRRARSALIEARHAVADILSARDDEIVFTSSGSEANNLALKGVVWAKRAEGDHIITTSIEHHSVLEACHFLEELGFRVTYLPVDGFGLVDPDEVRKTITAGTILISVMHANNEIGTIQPIAEIARVAKEHGVFFHTDAVQTFGTLAIDVWEIGVDLLSASAHKLYGPKGVGLLYVRQGVLLKSLIHGGAQERHRRAGTENIAGIIGLAKALQLAVGKRQPESERLTRLRDRLVRGITDSIDGVCLNGHPTKRLPNNVSICVEGLEGESLVLELNSHGIAASSGSACSSASHEPSHVLVALGLPSRLAQGALRLTLGRSTTGESVERVLEVLPEAVARLRDISEPQHHWSESHQTVSKTGKINEKLIAKIMGKERRRNGAL